MLHLNVDTQKNGTALDEMTSFVTSAISFKTLLRTIQGFLLPHNTFMINETPSTIRIILA